MRVLSQDEIAKIISAEINWHSAYYAFSDLNSEYKDGFIDGMKQIQKVIEIATKEINKRESEKDSSPN